MEAVLSEVFEAGSSVYWKAAAVKILALPLTFVFVLIVKGATGLLVNIVTLAAPAIESRPAPRSCYFSDLGALATVRFDRRLFGCTKRKVDVR